MVFEKLLKKKEDLNRVQKAENIMGYDKEEERIRKAPWYIKLAIYLKIKLSETEPFVAWMYFLGFILLVFVAVSFVLPFYNVVQDVPNKIPIFSTISGLLLGMYLEHTRKLKIDEKRCEVSIGSHTVIADNSRIEVTKDGEVIYLTNYNGSALIEKDKSKIRRYGEQKCLLIPKQVLEQFGSIQSKKAKAYPDCKLKNARQEDIDYGIVYIPRKVSETRLLKKLDAAEENVMILDEIITKLKEQGSKIANDTRGYYGKLIKQFVDEMTSMQDAFWGSKSRVQKAIRDELYHSGRSRYPSSYNRYGSGSSYFRSRGTPPWDEVSSTVRDREHEEGDMEWKKIQW